MKFTSLVMILLAASLMASCGGDPTSVGPTAASGSVSAAGARSLASAGTLTTMIANTKPNQTPSITSSPVRGDEERTGVGTLSRGIYDNCASVTAANNTDLDSDGIKVHVAAQFNCSGVTSGTSTMSLSGSFDIADLDDSKKWSEGGYAITYDMTLGSLNSSGDKFETRFNGKYGAVNTGSTLMLSSEFYYGVVGSEHGTAIVYNAHTKYDATFTPTNPASIYTAGSATHSGFYRIGGQYGSGTNASELDVTLTYSSTNLTYDSACTYFYKTGTFTFADAAGNAITYEYACTSYTAKYNGTAITL